MALTKFDRQRAGSTPAGYEFLITCTGKQLPEWTRLTDEELKAHLGLNDQSGLDQYTEEYDRSLSEKNVAHWYTERLDCI